MDKNTRNETSVQCKFSVSQHTSIELLSKPKKKRQAIAMNCARKASEPPVHLAPRCSTPPPPARRAVRTGKHGENRTSTRTGYLLVCALRYGTFPSLFLRCCTACLVLLSAHSQPTPALPNDRAVRDKRQHCGLAPHRLSLTH